MDLTGGDARGWAPLACGRARCGEAGASGPIRDVALTLDRVSLGKHEARGVRAVMIPEGLPVSLVAQSFLTTVGPVQIERDRMVLGSD